MQITIKRHLYKFVSFWHCNDTSVKHIALQNVEHVLGIKWFCTFAFYAFNRLPEIISRAVLPADQTEFL